MGHSMLLMVERTSMGKLEAVVLEEPEGPEELGGLAVLVALH